jgi:hypothetical protein
LIELLCSYQSQDLLSRVYTSITKYFESGKLQLSSSDADEVAGALRCMAELGPTALGGPQNKFTPLILKLFGYADPLTLQPRIRKLLLHIFYNANAMGPPRNSSDPITDLGRAIKRLEACENF